jgi:hypothetical protein
MWAFLVYTSVPVFDVVREVVALGRCAAGGVVDNGDEAHAVKVGNIDADVGAGIVWR